MKYFFYFFLIISISYSCNPTEETTNNESDYNIETVTVHREYGPLSGGDSYMDEYGRVIKYQGKDTTFLEFCKDSTVTINKTSGEIMKSEKEVCYPQKEVFIKDDYKINTDFHQIGKAYRKNVIKGISDFNVDDKTYKIFRMESMYYHDEKGETAFMHTNEYWNDKLGLLVKVDENFGRQRRRIIQLKDAQISGKPVKGIEVLIEKIKQDSTDWIQLDDEGKPLF